MRHCSCKMPISTSCWLAACWFGWITTREWKNSWRLAEAPKSTEKNHCILPHKGFLDGTVLSWMIFAETTSTWTSCHLAENHAPNLHVFHRPCRHASGWWWAPHEKLQRRVSRWSSCRCPNGIADFPVEPPGRCMEMWHKTAQIHSAMACYGYGKVHEIEATAIAWIWNRYEIQACHKWIV